MIRLREMETAGTATTKNPMTIALADEGDRERIYRHRHDIYAEELHQHPLNERRCLMDPLDDLNVYIAAKDGDELRGFISITPPGGKLSIDKYIGRDQLSFAIDDGTYEVRLLSVVKPHRGRGRGVAMLLMYAAMRWVEAHGGDRIVGMGRSEVMGMYEKAGLRPVGITVTSGDVSFEIMSSTIEQLRRVVTEHGDRLQRAVDRVNWELNVEKEDEEACYHGGAFFDAIGDEFDSLHRNRDVINADVLDAWFPPSPKVIAAMGEHLPWLMRTSPPTGCEGMARVIARARKVNEENVLPGAGSSDLIYLALRQWLTRDSRVLILDPMYGEYAHVLEKVIGCRVDRLHLLREDDYRIDPAKLAARMSDGYDMVLLVNPNSPTGQHCGREVMEDVLKNVPSRTRVWIDETYVEYAGPPGESLERFAVVTDNVVICKSMSKVYALSGMRAAYLCGPAKVIAPLRRVSPPWAVSLPGQMAAVNALQDPEYYARRYHQTHELREQLVKSLRSIDGVDVIPGVANFVLCHLSDDLPTASEVVLACRERGVFVRDIGNMGTQLGDRAMRIAVKDEQANRRIVKVFGDVLRQR